MENIRKLCDELESYVTGERTSSSQLERYFGLVVDGKDKNSKKFKQSLIRNSIKKFTRSNLSWKEGIRSYVVILHADKKLGHNAIYTAIRAPTRRHTAVFKEKYGAKIDTLGVKKECGDFEECKTDVNCQQQCGEEWTCFGTPDRMRRCWSPGDRRHFEERVLIEIKELARKEGVNYRRTSKEKLRYLKLQALRNIADDLNKSMDEEESGTSDEEEESGTSDEEEESGTSDEEEEKIVPDIVLIGDSILDNSYWGVGNKNTGELLRKIGAANGFTVADHSTEELTSRGLLDALRQKVPVDVGEHYVEHRAHIGYPYPGDGEVPVDPESIGIKNGSVVFLSVGGNDVVLAGDLNPRNILKNVKAIANIYKSAGAHVVYVIPYPPTDDMIVALPQLAVLYKQIVSAVRESGIDFLSLEEFDDTLRKEPTTPYETGIPEPTKKGANALAKMIAKHYKNLKTKKTKKKTRKPRKSRKPITGKKKSRKNSGKKPNKRTRKPKEPPSALDPLRLFYTSLFVENPESQMAIDWLTKYSLLVDGELVEPEKMKFGMNGDEI